MAGTSTRIAVGQVKVARPRMTDRKRCACGKCRQCQNYAKWDRMFVGFADKQRAVWGSKLLIGR